MRSGHDMESDQPQLSQRQESLRRRREERRLEEAVASADFPQLIEWIASGHDHAAASLKHLMTLVGHSLEKRSTWICSRISHLGRSSDCTCTACDRAWQSSYNFLVDRSFGLPPSNPDAEQHFPNQAPRPTGQPPHPRSALGSQPTSLDAWSAAVRRVTRYTGVETECLRAWNKDRGLVIRLDQKSYVLDRSGQPTDLATTFRDEWERIRGEWTPGLPPPSMTDNDTLVFLRAVYSDACQWGYQGETITKRRARRNYVNEDTLSDGWAQWLDSAYGTDESSGNAMVYRCLSAFVDALHVAARGVPIGYRSTDGRESHPVFTSLERAWAATRHEPLTAPNDSLELENIADSIGDD